MTIDYKNMQVGDRVRMPELNAWAGANQDLYYEVLAYCQSLEPAPQFEIETVRPTKETMELWLARTR
jgi:hypothetical protein